jgi:hypothetical protein
MPHTDITFPHGDTTPHTDTPHSDVKTHTDTPPLHEDVTSKPHIDVGGGHTDTRGPGGHIDILPR